MKPAPLFNASGRASPFRRPDSSLGRSPSTLRGGSPGGSPLKQPNHTPSQSPSKFNTSTSSLPFTPPPTAGDDRSWLTTRGTNANLHTPGSPTKSPLPRESSFSGLSNMQFSNYEKETAPTLRPAFARSTTASTPATVKAASPLPSASLPTAHRALPSNDPLSSIPPAHLHTMRESFAVLDHANSGAVTASDVSQQLAELGLDTSANALSQYFPSQQPSINLSSYLNLLCSDLTALSRQEELMAAFSAFDEDDSGQIDVGDLRDALLSTAPEPGEGGRMLSEREVDRVMDGFVGRRMFKKGAMGNNSGLGGKKEVFRYGDFVGGIWGAAGEQKTEG
ncbi:hypothetical protein E2P81_ATG00766 [Venturia nashicola]|uniref:EF-hand domain-containing protein n=1 Tax=Venturia nashicola TaxID=86259 RepID=A0A4Z1PKB5_9PEZI|nr:hypothetical protein E6O75_ATG00784 [Venturia nashicola]TLD38223.1 hypothetical protein E2P81_ATG00766 [Venturia nashicola]